MQSWLLFHALDRRAKQVVSRYMVPIQALRSLSAGSITGEWITNGKDIFFNAFNAYNLAIVYFFSFVEEICAIDDLKVLLFLLEFLGLPYRKQITSRNGISLCRSDLCASLAVTTILVQPIVDTGGGGIREQLCITFTRAIDRHIGSLVRLIRSFRKGNDMKEHSSISIITASSFDIGNLSLHLLILHFQIHKDVFAFFPSAEARGHNSNISTALGARFHLLKVLYGWFGLHNTALGWSENRTIYNSLLSASWVGSLEEDCQVGSAQYPGIMTTPRSITGMWRIFPRERGLKFTFTPSITRSKYL
ncbi:hypothetical protein ACJX0J_002926, partial (mitochondrion) [Zea mays]